MNHASWNMSMEVVGILNVTPDSFSDGAVGGEPGVQAAVAAALRMIDEGATWIDVGGESTRPGATPVDETTELARVIPVVRRLAEILFPSTSSTQRWTAQISVDTYRPAVARAAILAGATMINDVAAAREPGMLDLLREFPGTCTDPRFCDPAHRRIDLCLMHGYDAFHRSGTTSAFGDNGDGTGNDGTGKTDNSTNGDEWIVGQVYEFLQQRRDTAIRAGIAQERLVLDPGIGFGKKAAQNVAILQRIAEFRTLGCRLLVGVSRKRFLTQFLPAAGPALRAVRTGASIGVALAVAPYVDFLRVHDIGATCQALRAMERIRHEG